VVIKTASSGESLEQFMFETRYMDLHGLTDEASKDKE
jgi:hypothetical protein